MGSKAVQQYRQSIKGYSQALAGARNAGFRYTKSQLGALYGNLATSTGSTFAQLGATEARNFAALKRIQARSAQTSGRIVKQTEGRVRNLYGSAVAGGTNYGVLGAQARSNVKAQRGITQAGAIVRQGDSAAAATMAQGVAESANAADYALAQAKLYRAKNDAALVAEQQLELQKMRLQSQLDLQNYKKKLELEDKKSGTQAAGVVPAVAQDMSSALAYFKENQDKIFDGSLSPAAAAEKWVTDNITDPNESALAQPIATKLYSYIKTHDGQIDDATVSNIVQQQMSIYYPKYDYGLIGQYLTSHFLNESLTSDTSDTPTTPSGAAAPFGPTPVPLTHNPRAAYS